MQTELTSRADSVSNESLSVSERLRRDLAIHRAGNLLGIAIRARQEQGWPLDAAWCRQTIRSVIEGFEMETAGREPDAVVAARTEAERSQAERLARALQSRLSEERSRARLAAADRGHDLTAWAPAGAVPGDEIAECRRCARGVLIALGSDPVLSGSALAEGCLVSTERA